MHQIPDVQTNTRAGGDRYCMALGMLDRNENQESKDEPEHNT